MLLNSLSENVNTPISNFDASEFYLKQKLELILREQLYIYTYMLWVIFDKQEKKYKGKNEVSSTN